MALLYFGDNSNGSGSGSGSANFVLAGRFQNVAQSGKLVELGINFSSSMTGHIRLGVWAEGGDSGHPGALLLEAGILTNPGAGWNTLSGLDLPVVYGTWYWLGKLADASHQLYWDTTQTSKWASQAYGALPNPFPATVNNQNNRLCIRAGVELAGIWVLSYVPYTYPHPLRS